MKYHAKKWLDSIIELKGTKPFSICELPDSHKIHGGVIKPLVESGVLVLMGKKWIKGRSHQVHVWKVSPAYVERQNKKTCANHAVTFGHVDTGKCDIRMVSKAKTWTDRTKLVVETSFVVGKNGVVYSDTVHIPEVVL